MIRRDKDRLLKTIQILGKMAFGAGAREGDAPHLRDGHDQEAEGARLLTPGAGNKLHASRIECMAFHPLGSAKMSTTREAGVVKPTGETWDIENLFVIDGSILPTSIGVNSQLPIMAYR